MSITVSTVTPVYSGSEYLEELVEELSLVREKWAEEKAPVVLVESIFVDDDSIDESSQKLAQLAEKYPWVNVVTLSRNFGQHAATVAGICHSSSDWVVTLDEDLQHKPHLIESLFQCQTETKSDVVYAHPEDSVHGNSWRDKSSKTVKKILAKLTSTPQIQMFNSFRLIRGSIARAAASSSTSQTYLDIAISWFTKSFASVLIPMKDDRFIQSSSSGYGLAKLILHARRLFISSQVDIASSGLIAGAIAITVAIIIGAVVIVQGIFFPATIGTVGWASLVALVTFFGGVIITILCIALEYINVLAVNQLGKPTFFTVDRSQDTVLSEWFNRPEK